MRAWLAGAFPIKKIAKWHWHSWHCTSYQEGGGRQNKQQAECRNFCSWYIKAEPYLGIKYGLTIQWGEITSESIIVILNLCYHERSFSSHWFWFNFVKPMFIKTIMLLQKTTSLNYENTHECSIVSKTKYITKAWHWMNKIVLMDQNKVCHECRP